MSQIILQGPQLTSTMANKLSSQLNASNQVLGSTYKVTTPHAVSSETLTALRNAFPCDINVLPDEFDPKNIKLIISDMDSTLIQIECIDEIADFVGIKPKVSAITEAAMLGEIDFTTSLKERVALLAGLNTSTLNTIYNERLSLTPGAEQLVMASRKNNIITSLVSGGFTFFTDKLQKQLNLDHSLANTLEINDGKLTGKVSGSIVDASMKATFLNELCTQHQISPEQTIAVGDGANDLEMMEIAGLGVAFHAKPKVQLQADVVLNHCGLDGVLGFLELT